MEWAWRLLLEPRRLARRYLVQGPAAYAEVRGWSRRTAPARPGLSLAPLLVPEPSSRPARIVAPREHAALAVVVVTYNSARHIGGLLDDLAAEARDLPFHVIVVDNGSSDATAEIVHRFPGVTLRAGHGNVGYSAAINIAVRALPRPEPVLVLNPDVSVVPGAIRTMLTRMAATGAGIVVPRIHETDGSVYASLHYEPSVLRCAAEAAFGSRLQGRPAALSEIDHDRESYLYAQPVDWATGAALLIHPGALEAIGRWDERFFLYSEETDYFRRARDAGAAVWYEPRAVIVHDQGGSGRSPELDALLAVNLVRYARKHMGRLRAAAYTAFVILHEAVRSSSAAHRLALRSLVIPEARRALPHAGVPAAVRPRS
jgi:GT2 family glycosyltransferase